MKIEATLLQYLVFFIIAKDCNAACLCEGLHDQHTWHDGSSWEVSLEKLLVHGHTLDTNSILAYTMSQETLISLAHVGGKEAIE